MARPRNPDRINYVTRRRAEQEKERQQFNEKFLAIAAITAQWARKAEDEINQSTNQKMDRASIKAPDEQKQSHHVGQ